MATEPLDEQAIFEAARKMDSPEAREAYLRQACGDDETAGQRIRALLKAYEEGASFLESPAAASVDTLAEPSRELQGAVIGPYKLIEQIGEGGMGTVWMAQQTEPVKRLVAVKLIKAGMDSKQVIARFEAERQALALMDHPNIAKVFDGGTTGEPSRVSDRVADEETRRLTPLGSPGRPYFVMELVRGVPITKYCDEHHLTPRQRLELFVPICHAIQHAHQKGIIHRDLKPSNVLIALYDGRPVPKVIDFGVAKAAGQSLTEKTLVTGFGNIVGTLEYMAPEQVEINQLDIDTRSDIYSLGILLYELLTGSPPFSRNKLEKAGIAEMLRVIREEEPTKPSTKLSSSDRLPTLAANRGTEPGKLTKLVRGELDWIVMKALEKDRNRRYETANGFAMDVQRYLADEAVQACPPSVGYRLRKFLRRNRGPVLAGATIAALLVLGTICTTIGLLWALQAQHSATLAAQAEARERKEAETQRDRAQEAETLATERLHQVTLEKERATEAESKAVDVEGDTRAFSEFLVNDVLAVARPKGERGGLGIGVTVKEALDAAVTNVGVRFRDRPRAEALARHDLGVTYRLIGELDKSMEQLRLAYELRKKMYGVDDERTVHTGNSLAVVYQVQGMFAEAEPICVHALDFGSRVLGDEHPATLGYMNNLANLYQEQGRFDRAEPIFLRALEISRRTQGELHPDTLSILSNLGGMYTEQRRFAEAEPLCVEAVEGRRRVRGDEHPDTLKSRYNLARLYLMQGQYGKAEPELGKTLEARRRVLGDGHPHTLITMNTLAGLYQEQKQFAKAEPLFVEALAGRRRARGDRHPETLRTMNDLGVLYWNLKQLDRSIPLFEEALKAHHDRSGPNSLATLHVMANLGVNYRDAKRLPEGIDLLEKVCERMRKHPVASLGSLAGIPRVLAETYDQAGQFHKNERLYRAALELARRDGAPSTVSVALAEVGLNLFRQKKFSEAEPLLRECLTIREQHQPADWTTFNSRSILGGALLGQKKYAEAEAMLLSGYAGMEEREEKIPKAGKPRLTETLERLVQLYEATGEDEKAAEWRKKLEIRREAGKKANEPKEK